MDLVRVQLSPMPRNAVDRDLPAYRDGHFGNASCPHPGQPPPAGLPPNQWGPPNGHGRSCWGCNCVNGTQPCEAAQTCVWFTEGTSIGCAKPGGDSPSPSPHCNTTMVATNNDPYFRTMDLGVKALSKDDKYRWNPCATLVLPPAGATVLCSSSDANLMRTGCGVGGARLGTPLYGIRKTRRP